MPKKALPPEKRPIPKKQMALLRAYQVGDKGKPISGKEAAIRAGYPAATASDQASWILSRPNCRAWLDAQEKRVMEAHGITLDAIVSELAKCGFSNMEDYIRDNGDGKPVFKNIRDISREHMAAVTELTLDVRKEYEGRGEDREHVADIEKIKFKLTPKVDALVKMAQMLGYGKSEGEGSEGGGERTVTIRVVGGLPQPPEEDE